MSARWRIVVKQLGAPVEIRGIRRCVNRFVRPWGQTGKKERCNFEDRATPFFRTEVTIWLLVASWVIASLAGSRS